MTIVAGYDVGGAHLKVARWDGDQVIAVRQVACPLWQGLGNLDAALTLVADLTAGASRHAVTMTAELCETFPSRQAGVEAIVSHLQAKLAAPVAFYAGLQGFADAGGAIKRWEAVASANFLATAQVIARFRPHALLIDIGSTTTDIVACDRPLGLSDAERLQTGELVYTGLTRTTVPSVTTEAVLAGNWQTLARDNFATMADVRRVLDELPEDVDLHSTTDGREKSLHASLARLARGFGRDAELAHLDVWRSAAAYIREAQLRSIYDGAIQVLSRPGHDFRGGVVCAGIGASVASVVADRLGLASVKFGQLIKTTDACVVDATRYAPAVAVAMLA